MRLIDADALLDEVMDRHCNDCDRRKGIKNGKYRIIYSIGDAPCRSCDVDDLKGEIEDAPAIEPDPDTISRKQTLEHLKKRLYESALNNDGIASRIFEEIADNRVQIWVDEIPPSPTVTADTDTISRPKGRWKTIAFLTVECPECHAQIHELEYGNFCPNCGADMRQ